MESALHARDEVGVQDAVWLDEFESEEVFIDNLEKRFKNGLIYTYIGPVLISVNPYKELGLYSKANVEKYRNVNFFEVPPHVFAIADTAYRSLKNERKDQCVLISGESGAGKTEASKKILEYVATVSGHSVVAKVKERLLLSNPLLEAFGNATTTRNDNSSRFGKYMDISFDFKGEPVGGHILTYLLEKCRVVHQAEGERNFHIFYQLLSGAPETTLNELHLSRNPKDYRYLAQSKMDDSKEWHLVTKAMETCGFSSQESKELVDTIGGILHLGNVDFKKSDMAEVSEDGAAVQFAALLLGCTEEILKKALTHRTIDARGDFVTSPLNHEQGFYARDALSKAVYSRVFDWLVSKINQSLQPQDGSTGREAVMGILDIYGFEIFTKNSFEQLCINYCNEKLHQVFIELTLRSEQEEYLREGVTWTPVAYFDNKPICEMIETLHTGIISLMDEECLRPGDTTDLSLLSKLKTSLKGQRFFEEGKRGSKDFVLAHYAGKVAYDVHGFLDKNNDLLFRDLKEAMAKSSNGVIQSVFSLQELERKKRPETAATQFKLSVNRLIGILMSKDPSYIRCIKPNDYKMSGAFDKVIVGHQVKYLGLMENLRVRRAGYAYRRAYEAFLERYKSLCPETWPKYHGTAKDGVRIIMKAFTKGEDEYCLGETKVFIREARTLFAIEDAFQKRKHGLASQIQAIYKGRLQKRAYLKKKAAANVFAKHWKRVLAQRQLARRKKAAGVIRGFVHGFIHRHNPSSTQDVKFLGMVRAAWLRKLVRQLPKKILRHKWPQAPQACKEASERLRKIHLRLLVRYYMRGLTKEKKRLLDRKVIAERLFKGKKEGYEATIPQVFVDNRLSPELDSQRKSLFEVVTKESSEQTLYCLTVAKYDRRGSKKRDGRVLVVTTGGIYLLEEKNLKLKQKFGWKSLAAFAVTSKKDSLFVLKVVQETEKKGKGDMLMEAPKGLLIELAVHVAEATGGNASLVKVEGGSLTFNIGGGKEGKAVISQGPQEEMGAKKKGNTWNVSIS